MKKSMLAVRLWCEGAVLFVLRLLQLGTGFDPDTGLALPSLAGRCLWIGLLLAFAAEAALCLSRPKGNKRSYTRCFDGFGGPALGGITAGSFLLMAGGALLLLRNLPPTGSVALATAAAGFFGVAGGAGLLVLAMSFRAGSPATLALPPAMFFSVLFVLAVYFPEEADPVLDRYYLPVLGAAVAAYFLYQLSGFFRSEGSLRRFSLVSGLTVVTCAAASADCLQNPGRLLVYAGFAVTATAFVLLLREEPLPEPEAPAAKEAASA